MTEQKKFNWQKFARIRSIWTAIFGAVLIGGVLAMVFPPLGYLAIPAFFLIWIGSGYE